MKDYNLMLVTTLFERGIIDREYYSDQKKITGEYRWSGKQGNTFNVAN